MNDRLSFGSSRWLWIALALVLPLAHARTALPDAAVAQPPIVGPWQPVFSGVDHAELSASTPRIVRGHTVRVELGNPNIRFVATPGNEDRPGETDGMRTSTFLKRMGCQVAINASPFRPVRAQEGQPHDVLGLMISDGAIVSPADAGYPALMITRDKRVRICETPESDPDIVVAVSGFHTVLRNGQTVADAGPLHPRTAAGVSRDDRYLYLLVIDGRQPGYSEGATTAELGDWLRQLGAWEGINLDGGGTTTLVFAGPDGAPRVVNRPIHAGIPGRERVSASHLGIHAAPSNPPAPREPPRSR